MKFRKKTEGMPNIIVIPMIDIMFFLSSRTSEPSREILGMDNSVFTYFLGKGLKGLADALQHMELFHEGRVVGVFLDFEMLEHIESTEGLVDMIRKVEGTELAVVLKEKEKDSCRVSMRSKGLDVTKIATQFGGGGHVRAAGCSIARPFAEAKAALLAAIADALEPQA